MMICHLSWISLCCCSFALFLALSLLGLITRPVINNIHQNLHLSYPFINQCNETYIQTHIHAMIQKMCDNIVTMYITQCSMMCTMWHQNISLLLSMGINMIIPCYLRGCAYVYIQVLIYPTFVHCMVSLLSLYGLLIGHVLVPYFVSLSALLNGFTYTTKRSNMFMCQLCIVDRPTNEQTNIIMRYAYAHY